MAGKSKGKKGGKKRKGSEKLQGGKGKK